MAKKIIFITDGDNWARQTIEAAGKTGLADYFGLAGILRLICGGAQAGDKSPGNRCW